MGELVMQLSDSHGEVLSRIIGVLERIVARLDRLDGVSSTDAAADAALGERSSVPLS